MKTLVLFYSRYGHIWQMAEAVAEGARQVPGNEVVVKRVPETYTKPPMPVHEGRLRFAHVPVARPTELADYDAILLGAPTRYGAIASPMQAFLDATGPLCARGALVGKAGGAFTDGAAQPGGPHTTLHQLHAELLHLGLITVALPVQPAKLRPRVASWPQPGPEAVYPPSADELAGARCQGRRTADMGRCLAGG